MLNPDAPQSRLVRVYFDDKQVCLGVGSNEPDLPTFQGDYFASEDMRIPVALGVPEGMTYTEIREAESKAFKARWASRHARQ